MHVIPVANPKANYLAQRSAIDAAITAALDGGMYIGGPQVEAFEREFAGYVGAGACVSVASGTDALLVLLRSMGIGPGHTVVTVSHTAVATATAIDLAGARALLVDIDPDDFTMSPAQLDDAIRAWKGDPIKAIIPVHLYGHPADMDSIMEIARTHAIPVIEDCAQAHGARYRGRMVGTFGMAAAFSFYPTKNLGALGDGGGITTSDLALADACRLQKQYGWRQRYISETTGMNSRLDEIQAAALRVKLATLDEQNRGRAAVAATYAANGRNARITHPVVRPEVSHVYHQYVVRSEARDALRAHMTEQGIGTAILYPEPVHLQQGYRDRVSVGVGGLEATERACGEILAVPMYPELRDEERGRVAEALRSF